MLHPAASLAELRSLDPSPRLVRGLSAEADASPATVLKLLRGEPVRRTVADRIIKALVAFKLLAPEADTSPALPTPAPASAPAAGG